MFPSRLFDLYYGSPASGKSEAARQVVTHLYKTTGRAARVIVGDGSTATYEHLMNKGIVEVCEFSHRPWPLDVVARLTEGWFPIDGDPHGPLVEPAKQPRRDNVHMYVIEGASVMGAYIMGHIKGGLAWQSGQGVQIGQDSPYRIFSGELDEKGKLKEGPGTTVGGNPMSHYNVGQGAMLNAVIRSKGLAPYVIWTAHEATNDPDRSLTQKELIVGPEVISKSMTQNFQRLFGNTLHFQTVAKKTTVMDTHTGKSRLDIIPDYRIWTRDHFSADGATSIRHKAVSRGVRNILPYYNDILTYYAAVQEQLALDDAELGMLTSDVTNHNKEQ